MRLLSLSHLHLTSRGRLKPKQASGFYPNKYGFRVQAAGVIAAVL
jgi:hypothetical protein